MQHEQIVSLPTLQNILLHSRYIKLPNLNCQPSKYSTIWMFHNIISTEYNFIKYPSQSDIIIEELKFDSIEKVSIANNKNVLVRNLVSIYHIRKKRAEWPMALNEWNFT